MCILRKINDLNDHISLPLPWTALARKERTLLTLPSPKKIYLKNLHNLWNSICYPESLYVRLVILFPFSKFQKISKLFPKLQLPNKIVNILKTTHLIPRKHQPHTNFVRLQNCHKVAHLILTNDCPKCIRLFVQEPWWGMVVVKQRAYSINFTKIKCLFLLISEETGTIASSTRPEESQKFWQ